MTEPIIGRLVPWIVGGGRLRMATDIDDAEQMLAVCSAHQNSMGIVARPSDRPVTRFERKGVEAGRA